MAKLVWIVKEKQRIVWHWSERRILRNIFLVFVKAELLCLPFYSTWFIIAAIRLLSLPFLLAVRQNWDGIFF